LPAIWPSSSVSLAAGATVTDAEKAYPDAAAILVDSHAPGGHGGTGKTVSWRGLSAGRLPLILAGGLSPANVAAAVNLVKPWAVDVSSGVESAPGIKDAKAIRRFIEEARRGQRSYMATPTVDTWVDTVVSEPDEGPLRAYGGFCFETWCMHWTS
jgi:phosphoribosylanthranilate isomerase